MFSLSLISPRFIATAALLAAAAALCGCATHCDSAQKTDMDNRALISTPPAIPATLKDTQNDGSLFQAANQLSYWRDDTARNVGDIVTVQVQVSQTATKDASTNLNRENHLNAGITSFFGAEGYLPGLAKTTAGSAASTLAATTAAGKRVNNTTPEQLIKADSTNTHKGEGDTKRNDTITANISAIVTHVYPNGNMRIHGSQNTLINHDNTLLTVEGVVRPSDIAYNNTVSSNRIAQCRIEITGRGVINDLQSPGFASRLFNWVWPF